ASEVAYDVRPITSPHDAIVAARDRLMQRGKLPLRDWLAAKETADKLHQSAMQRFQRVAQELQQEIGSLGTGNAFRAVDNFSETDVHKEAGQALLLLGAGRYDAIGIKFRALGIRFRGIVGVDPYLFIQSAEPVPLRDGTFLINYEEDLRSAQTRFSAWLDRVIVEGLNEWRKTL
ncbi:MAG: hypothetical protein ABSF54_24490, partial [Bryobacteraceae bacterium]